MLKSCAGSKLPGKERLAAKGVSTGCSKSIGRANCFRPRRLLHLTIPSSRVCRKLSLLVENISPLQQSQTHTQRTHAGRLLPSHGLSSGPRGHAWSRCSASLAPGASAVAPALLPPRTRHALAKNTGTDNYVSSPKPSSMIEQVQALARSSRAETCVGERSMKQEADPSSEPPCMAHSRMRMLLSCGSAQHAPSCGRSRAKRRRAEHMERQRRFCNGWRRVDATDRKSCHCPLPHPRGGHRSRRHLCGPGGSEHAARNCFSDKVARSRTKKPAIWRSTCDAKRRRAAARRATDWAAHKSPHPDAPRCMAQRPLPGNPNNVLGTIRTARRTSIGKDDKTGWGDRMASRCVRVSHSYQTQSLQAATHQ